MHDSFKGAEEIDPLKCPSTLEPSVFSIQIESLVTNRLLFFTEHTRRTRFAAENLGIILFSKKRHQFFLSLFGTKPKFFECPQRPGCRRIEGTVVTKAQSQLGPAIVLGALVQKRLQPLILDITS